MCTEQQASSKWGLINLLGDCGSLGRLKKTTCTPTQYSYSWMSADCPSLSACHGPRAKVPLLEKAVFIALVSQGWIMAQIGQNPMSEASWYVETKEDFGSEEDYQMQVYVCVINGGFGPFEPIVPGVKRSLLCTCSLISHQNQLGDFSPHFSMSVSAELACWVEQREFPEERGVPVSWCLWLLLRVQKNKFCKSN